MNHKDLYVGATVYHTIFPHWGKGKIIRFRNKDLFGYKTADKYRVEWENRDVHNHHNTTWSNARCLRKTFNQKKADKLASLKQYKKTCQKVCQEEK